MSLSQSVSLSQSAVLSPSCLAFPGHTVSCGSQLLASLIYLSVLNFHHERKIFCENIRNVISTVLRVTISIITPKREDLNLK